MDWREASGLTLATAAERLGCSPSHVKNIESGEDKPSGALAFRIERESCGSVPAASFFEVSLGEVANSHSPAQEIA